jgi:membrane associated rhomboid family serine protease
MAECEQCGAYENLPYQCHRCGGTFCAEHRLPENHDCPGLAEWNDPSGVFDSGFDDGVESRGGSSEGLAARLGLSGGTGDVLGYFRGNVSYTVLGLMWLTFALQFLVFPLVDLLLPVNTGVGSPLWDAAFVLEPANLAYVWTWVTSVFAHGGFGHIAMNSIALYFFGPVVERYVGSRRFAALFVGAGVLAGLAQIGTSAVVNGGLFGPGVLGASGAIMAVLGLLTVLNPGLKVYLYFVIPMPLWALTFGFAAFSLVAGFGVAGSGALGGNVAHFAHLSGLVVGLVYGSQVKGRTGVPNSLQLGGGGGGMGGPGRGGRF